MLDRFLLERSCNETDHGILENNRISLQEWKKALAGFDTGKLTLQLGPIHSQLMKPRSLLQYFALYLLGGGISGVCQKPGQLQGNRGRDITDVLICPSCRMNEKEIRLNKKGALLVCHLCSRSYPIVDGILFLFAEDKLEELYPEIFSSMETKRA